MCIAGARWVQEEILSKNRSDRLSVIAIWFRMFPGDSRSRWPAQLLSDSRVVHLWDEEKLAGTWLGKFTNYRGGNHILWDAWLLFGTESEWHEAPTHLLGTGRTIVQSREELRKKVESLPVQ